MLESFDYKAAWEQLLSGGTVQYPDCGGDYMSPCISLNSQHCTPQKSKFCYM